MGKKIFLLVLSVFLTFDCSLATSRAEGRPVTDTPDPSIESSGQSLQHNSILYQFAKGFLDSQAALIPVLKDSSPVEPSVYEDKNGNPFAIVYGVEKDGLITGSIVLNYDLNCPTLLEFNQIPPPHLTNAKELICKNIGLRENQIADELRYIYVFPLLFYIRFQVQTAYQTKEAAYYSYNEAKCVDLSQIPNMPLSLKKGKQVTILSYGKVLSDVPDYNTSTTNLPNNCGPVAGANILGYWAKHGYPTLQYPYDQWDGWDLTTCLYQDMRTYLGFTMSNYFRSGILLHANTAHTNPYSNNPYPCQYHFSAGVSSPSFYSFCTEIDYNRPLAVLIYWQQNALRWHWITGIGYSSYASNQTIIVRSGWGWGLVYLNYNAPYLDNGYVNIYCFDYVYPAP